MRLWDVESGRELRRFEGREGASIVSVAWSPDGRYALSGGGTEIKEGQWLPGEDFALRLWRLPPADNKQTR